MTDQKVQIKYKYDNTTYAPLDIPTTGDMAYRDTTNVPIVGTNGTEVIQGMANSFFPLWGSTMRYVFIPEQVGWLTLEQGYNLSNFLVIINATEYNDPNEWMKFSFDGGENWFNYTDSETYYLDTVKYSAVWTDSNGNQVLTAIRSDSNSQNAMQGRSTRYTFNPTTKAVTRSKMDDIGFTSTVEPFYTAMCSAPSGTLVFTADGMFTHLNLHGTATWTLYGVSTVATPGIHTAINSTQTMRTIICGTNGFVVSDMTGLKNWKRFTLDAATYGNLTAMVEDKSGTIYILGKKKIRMIDKDNWVNNVGKDIDIPTLSISNESWCNLIVHNDTIMIISDMGNIAILPIKKLALGTWRFITRIGATTPERWLLKSVGSRVIIGRNNEKIGGISGSLAVYSTYANPPSSIKK